MDHSEALRLQAAEKYVLGELSPELREKYEEHYFDCEECAENLKSAVAFVDVARDLFRQESHTEIRQAGGASPWISWLRPVIAAPAIAALLIVVIYEGFVAIPRLRRDAANARAVTAEKADFVSLIGANSRGEGARVYHIHRDRPVILEIDIAVSPEFANYVCQVREHSGRIVYQDRVSATDARSTVHLIVPRGGLAEGGYNLTVLGNSTSASNAASGRELDRIQFFVEALP